MDRLDGVAPRRSHAAQRGPRAAVAQVRRHLARLGAKRRRRPPGAGGQQATTHPQQEAGAAYYQLAGTAYHQLARPSTGRPRYPRAPVRVPLARPPVPQPGVTQGQEAADLQHGQDLPPRVHGHRHAGWHYCRSELRPAVNVD